MVKKVRCITEHLANVIRNERVGVGLVRTQRLTVASQEEAVFTLLDFDYILHCHVIDDVQERFEVETRWHSLSLWTLFAIGSDDCAIFEVAAQVNLDSVACFVFPDENE